MAKGNSRKRKQTEEAAAPTAPTPGGNGFDRAKTQSFVERIESLMADKRSVMMTAVSKCGAIQGDIKLVYDEAKDETGLPKKALRNVIKARELERKAADVRDDLEGEDQDNFDLIRQALGDLADTPLGRAALPPVAKLPEANTSTQPFRPDDEPRTANPD